MTSKNFLKLFRSLTALLGSGVARQMRVHLPPDLVAKVARVLLVGKVGYGLSAVLFPCLVDNAPRSTLSSDLQVRVNDVARAICGATRSYHHSVDSLLRQSGLPSVNRLAVRSVAVEAWKCLGALGNTSFDPLSSIFGHPRDFDHQGQRTRT